MMRPEDEYNRGYYDGETSTPDAMRGYEARQREEYFYKTWKEAHKPIKIDLPIDTQASKPIDWKATRDTLRIAGAFLLVYLLVTWAWQLKNYYPVLEYTYQFVLTWYNIFLIEPTSFIFNIAGRLYHYVVDGRFNTSTDVKWQLLRLGQVLMYGLFVGIFIAQVVKRIKPVLAGKTTAIKNVMTGMFIGIYIMPGVILALVWIGTMLFDVVNRFV